MLYWSKYIYHIVVLTEIYCRFILPHNGMTPTRYGYKVWSTIGVVNRMSHTSLHRSQDSMLCTEMGPQCPNRLWDPPSNQAAIRRLFHAFYRVTATEAWSFSLMSVECRGHECVEPYLHPETHIHGVVHRYKLRKLRSMCETASDITYVNGEKNNKNQEINTRIRKQMKNTFTEHEFVKYVNLKSEYAFPLLFLIHYFHQ